jgi:hypothetical protein
MVFIGLLACRRSSPPPTSPLAQSPFPFIPTCCGTLAGSSSPDDGHDTRAIQAYLGHRSIMSTVRYTALTPNRFKNFCKD